MHRRDFLKSAASLAALSLLPIGLGGWAAGGGSGNRRLVVVLLRGAVDGLNVVVPHGEDAYYQSRPGIAIPRPGAVDGAIDLDGHFGLHPAMGALVPLWQAKQLAFVHACGSNDPTRSHFDAQDFMESGTPGEKNTPDGWMNRLLGELPSDHSPAQALALGETVPRILSGPRPVASMPLGRGQSRPMAIDRPRFAAAFDKLYTGDDALTAAFHEGEAARKALLQDLQDADAEMRMADRGAPPARGFSADAQQLARMVAHDPGIQLAFLAVGGWDTHVNQGGAKGQLAGKLKALSDGLATFATTIGSAWDDTVVLVMSEFGRTVRENGNGGTDHGHGNVMWIMGGKVQGGQVYGQWPGLSDQALYEGRDLAITTDFRQVAAGVLRDHLGVSAEAIARVFPGLGAAPGPRVIA